MVRQFCRSVIVAAGALLLVSFAHAAPSDSTLALLQKAVNGDWRSPAHKARDRYRHPIETLQFFGLKPDMTVIEMDPGGGWYTEILAPVLSAHGHLIEATGPEFAKTIKANPAVFGHVEIVPFDPPKQVRLGPDNSADMVLTFRNAHDWLIDSPEELAAIFKAMFDVLKPGGVLGFVEHRAKPFMTPEDSATALHRISEDYVIALALKTGFRLAGVSEINANPKDPEDVNVHRLPPNLVGPEEEHAKMLAIGESDRMTLKFVKP